MSGSAAAVLTKPGLSQDRMAGARHRGRASSRWRHHPEVAHSAAALREAYSGVAFEMGEAGARAHLAGATRRRGPAMAQSLLRRSQAHRRRADAGAAQSRPRRRPSRCDPVRQFDRARADDAGRDAGAPAGGAGVAGLFADEPGSSQAQISLRPDQACGRDGAGRADLREGLEGARSHRRHRRSRRCGPAKASRACPLPISPQRR